MTTSFPSDANIAVPYPDADDIRLVGGDEVQPVAVGIPCYHWLSAAFFANFVSVAKVADMPVQVTKGVYTPQAMRLIVKQLLKIEGWKRLVVIEADMLLPHDAIIKHAMHTDPVVGSMYFQHSPPHQANVMLANQEGKVAHLTPIGVATMLSKPALYKCDVVSFGCTSIRRDVLENWPSDVPMFRNDFEPSAKDDPFTQGEVSHDVYFCREVRKQGYEIYLDSSIVCQHLTEGSITQKHYLAAHADALGLTVEVNRGVSSPIVLPNRAQRRAQQRGRRLPGAMSPRPAIL